MKKTFVQTVTQAGTGKVYLQRELTFDEDEKLYSRPAFLAHLVESEDEFLSQCFSVDTQEKDNEPLTDSELSDLPIG